MTGNDKPFDKANPETLELRAKPRRVTRFKRHVVIGVAAIITATILGASWLALRTPSLKVKTNSDELYSTDTKPTPDELAALPPSYDKVKPPALGAPLPGDLGAPIVAREKSLGMSPTLGSLGPKGEEDAERAEQLHLAQLARQAEESGVFFQTANSNHGTAASANGAIQPIVAAPMTQVAASENAGRPSQDSVRDQNDQQHKIDFASQHSDDAIYNPHAIQTPTSPYEVLAGTLIPASLITGLDSDLPGFVIAQITQNIYDTVTGSTLLIPQGSRLVGSYDSVVAFGQSRALVVWQRIIMPDGSSIEIDNLPATDTGGYSGLEDSVDYHTWALLKGVAISTLLGVGSQLAMGDQQNDLLSAIRQSTQDSVNQAGQQLTQKDLNIQPTIKVRPGWPLRVIVHKDLVLHPYES